MVSETHLFSGTLVNEVRAGYNRISSSRLQPNANTDGIPAQFGIPGVPQGNSNGGLGSLVITGLNTLGSNQILPSIELSTTTQVTDNLTKGAAGIPLRLAFNTKGWDSISCSLLRVAERGTSVAFTLKCLPHPEAIPDLPRCY